MQRCHTYKIAVSKYILWGVGGGGGGQDGSEQRIKVFVTIFFLGGEGGGGSGGGGRIGGQSSRVDANREVKFL